MKVLSNFRCISSRKLYHHKSLSSVIRFFKHLIWNFQLITPKTPHCLSFPFIRYQRKISAAQPSTRSLQATSSERKKALSEYKIIQLRYQSPVQSRVNRAIPHDHKFQNKSSPLRDRRLSLRHIASMIYSEHRWKQNLQHNNLVFIAFGAVQKKCLKFPR